MTQNDFKEKLYWSWRKRMSQVECRRESYFVPQENRFGENWSWEDTNECLEIDTEFQDEEYFEKLESEEKYKLFRHMENFMMERGITQCFMRNYLKLDEAIREEEENSENY